MTPDGAWLAMRTITRREVAVQWPVPCPVCGHTHGKCGPHHCVLMTAEQMRTTFVRVDVVDA